MLFDFYSSWFKFRYVLSNKVILRNSENIATTSGNKAYHIITKKTVINVTEIHIVGLWGGT